MNDRAPVHGRVLDRHKACELVAGDDKATTVLRQMTREADQGRNQCEPESDAWRFGVQSSFLERFQTNACPIPPGAISRNDVDRLGRNTERKARVP